jgi:CHASE2 domain-containing sensor protein
MINPLRLRPARRGVLAATVAVVIATLTLVLYGTGALNDFERQSIDVRFSLRGPHPPGDDIVIVGIDQSSLQELATRPPLPRGFYATVLDRIRAGSPRVIAVDTQFIGRSDPANDAALLDAIDRDGPVLLATHDGPEGLITVPADAVDAPGAVVGSAAIEKDSDGVLRRMIYAPVDTETLAVRAAEMFRDRSVDAADFHDNHAWVDFRGPPGTFPHYSFEDVMAGRIPPDAFTGKAVLIGMTDPVGDVFVTSISSIPMPGVEVHANALWTVLAGVPLRSAGSAVNVVLILTLIALVATFGSRRSGLWTFTGSVGLLVVFLGAAQLAFNTGWIVTVVYPVVALALTAAAMIGIDAFMVRQERARLERDVGELAAPLKPPTFFISYRRSQNAPHARGIQKELVRRYGPTSVFMDTASIDYGEAFPDRIDGAIRVCGVMLVLIGPDWLEAVDGHRRIDGPDDWVCREIATGLQRHNAVVVPVLVDGARAPTGDELPESIKGLATRHAIALTGADLSADIDGLMNSLDRGRRRTALRAAGWQVTDTTSRS